MSRVCRMQINAKRCYNDNIINFIVKKSLLFIHRELYNQ